MASPFPLTQNFTTLSAGHIVTDKEWNSSIGALYSYINTTLLGGGLNVLTTNGDTYYYDGTRLQRLAIGTNGQHLVVTAGIPAWASLVTAASLQNKGDLLYCSDSTTHALAALAAGTSGQVLTVDGTGIPAWASAVGSVPIGGIILWFGTIASIGTGATVGYQLCDGSNGTPNMVGLFPVGAGPSGAAGGIGSPALGATGGTTSHFHSVGFAVASTAGASANSPTGSTGITNNIPPYKALAFIQRMS